MADSQPWLKTLKRFGSRLSLHGSRRSSLSIDSDHGVWLARYNHRRSAEISTDTDPYATPVELVRVTRDGGHEDGEDTSQDIEAGPDTTERTKSDGNGEDRLAMCHEQHPLSLAVASPDPESIRRRPLPPLPPAERTDDGRLQALSAQLAHLSHQGWYWGPLTLEETQIILADLPDGSYIVRDSHNESYLLAIGLRADGRTVRRLLFYGGPQVTCFIQNFSLPALSLHFHSTSTLLRLHSDSTPTLLPLQRPKWK